MSTSPYALTPETARDLLTEASTFDAGTGEDFEVSCNLKEEDHAHVIRFGLPGQPTSRVLIATHQAGSLAQVLVHPAQARAYAAAILNAADEADGTKPLLFSPRDVAPEDLDTPGTDQ